MVDFAIFNEKSLPIPNKFDPMERFGIFFSILRELKKNNITTLRTSEDFRNYKITENENLQIYFGKIVDREFKTRMRSFIANNILVIDNPLIKETEEDQKKCFYEVEYVYDDKEVISLGCADIWNTIAVSFLSNECWNYSNLELKKLNISPDGVIKEILTSVRHSSMLSHTEFHREFFSDKINSELNKINRKNFFIMKDTIFSRIEFCIEVEAQIENLSKEVFEAMLQILIDVDRGIKDIKSFKYSGESESVRCNPNLITLRKFTVDGEKVYFDNHLKSLPNGNRMYFLERGEKIYIGYVGQHLPTARF